MNRNKIFVITFLLLLCKGISAQQSTLTASFKAADGRIKPVSISLTKPLFKFDDPNGYWFVNPHNGQRHFSTSPEHFKAIGSGAANVTFNEQANDFDIYQGTSGDSNESLCGGIISSFTHRSTIPSWAIKTSRFTFTSLAFPIQK